MCVCAGGDQKRICKCKVADVNMPYAGGNQLRKAPAISKGFLNFL